MTVMSTALLGRLRRLRDLKLGQFSVIWVEGELFPYLPYVFEGRFYQRYKNVVVDYDDAIYARYERYDLLRGKIARIMSSAKEVIVGNGRLERYARRYRSDVNVIPTSVDVGAYESRKSYELCEAKIVIGWIGTPMTSFFLNSYSHALSEIATKHPMVLRCIGTPPDFSMPGVEVENIPWNERTEAEIVKTFDIGIMPLGSDEISLGKCGLKLIQYMACGVPAVGSAVGANMEIISDGMNGFTVSDQNELARKLELLIGSEAIRRSLGRAGRATVESKYSVQVGSSQLDSILRNSVESAATRAAARPRTSTG